MRLISWVMDQNQQGIDVQIVIPQPGGHTVLFVFPRYSLDNMLQPAFKMAIKLWISISSEAPLHRNRILSAESGDRDVAVIRYAGAMPLYFDREGVLFIPDSGNICEEGYGPVKITEEVLDKINNTVEQYRVINASITKEFVRKAGSLIIENDPAGIDRYVDMLGDNPALSVAGPAIRDEYGSYILAYAYITEAQNRAAHEFYKKLSDIMPLFAMFGYSTLGLDRLKKCTVNSGGGEKQTFCYNDFNGDKYYIAALHNESDHSGTESGSITDALDSEGGYFSIVEETVNKQPHSDQISYNVWKNGTWYFDFTPKEYSKFDKCGDTQLIDHELPGVIPKPGQDDNQEETPGSNNSLLSGLGAITIEFAICTAIAVVTIRRCGLRGSRLTPLLAACAAVIVATGIWTGVNANGGDGGASPCDFYKTLPHADFTAHDVVTVTSKCTPQANCTLSGQQ